MASKLTRLSRKTLSARRFLCPLVPSAAAAPFLDGDDLTPSSSSSLPKSSLPTSSSSSLLSTPRPSPPRRHFGQPVSVTHPHLLDDGQLTPGISAAEYEARRRQLVGDIEVCQRDGETDTDAKHPHTDLERSKSLSKLISVITDRSVWAQFKQ